MTDRPSVYSGRSFFFIAPEMSCLNIVWVVIPPRSAHSFRIPVVWNHIVIVCELFVADGTLLILLDNLAVQELSHLSGGSEFPISSRMMRIVNASNPRLQSAHIGRLFPTTAGNRFVDRAVLIATKPHSISSWENRQNQSLVCGDRDEWLPGRRVSRMGCYNACPRGTMTNLTGVIRQLQKERQRVHGEMERLNAALAALGSLGSLEGSKRSFAPKARRPMSAAARKRIATAQRARWAKWKKNKQTK